MHTLHLPHSVEAEQAVLGGLIKEIVSFSIILSH